MKPAEQKSIGENWLEVCADLQAQIIKAKMDAAAAFEAGRVAGLEEAAKVADIAASNATNRMNVIRYGAEECEHAKDHLEYAAEAIRALKEKSNG